MSEPSGSTLAPSTQGAQPKASLSVFDACTMIVGLIVGAGVFGTSIAMHGEITAKNGAIEQSNFHDYQLARMNSAPRQVHVHFIPSTELAAGIGEPGVLNGTQSP